MTGTLNSGIYSKNVTLSYANDDVNIKGYNLLGNPTPHEITFSKTSSVSDGYYYLNNSDSWIYEISNTVPAGRGFLVKANDEGQSVTLNPQSKRDDGETQGTPYLQIDVDGERAYIKLTEGVSMPLLTFNEQHSSIYLTRDHKNYIMLVNDEGNTLDLSYEPKHGLHQLNVTLEDSSLEYLHLFDRFTGADIDLLSTPNYKFESTINDYPSRFVLMFEADNYNQEESDAFAIVSDGQIIVKGVDNHATLQVIDMAGRVINNYGFEASCYSISTAEMTSGVYLLKLINGDETKTQKIIIK